MVVLPIPGGPLTSVAKNWSVLVAGTQPEAMARAALALGVSASMVTSGCLI